MKLNFHTNENDYEKIYRQKGYIANYILDKNILIDVSNLKEFNPNEVFIIAKYLFEGAKNPRNTSMLFVIRTIDGSKGMLRIRNNAIKNSDLTTFISEIPKKNISGKDNLL